MKYLKENKTTIFIYLDFLKDKDKVQIDGSKASSPMTTIDGLFDIHPNAEHLEIGESFITDVSELSKMKKLKVLMLYSNFKLDSLNGLNGLTLDNLSLTYLPSFDRIGKVNVSAKKLVIQNCPKFKLDLTGISDIEELDISKCGTIKDFTFLKDRNINKVYMNDTKIESLYGIQYSPNTILDFRGDNGNTSFLYHQMFYDSLKGKPIKDYWKEIVGYWMNMIEKGKTTLLGLSHNDIKETFIEGIKLPVEEIERLFTDEEKRYIKSVMGVNKFKL